jgi:hypothetical protein
MAYESQVQNVPGVVASGDLSSHQYKFTRMTASGVALNSVKGAACLGVLQDKPSAAGQAATVAYGGVSKVKSGAAFSKGDNIMSDENGKAIVAASVASAAEKLSGGTAPFVLAAGDTIVVDVDNAGDATVTWDAAAGYDEDTTTYPVADQDGLTLKLKVDGGTEQTVTFSGAHTTAAAIAASINAQVYGAAASVVGGQVRITSDRKGTSSSIAITGGTHGLTWAAAVAGTGDVAFIDAVTVAEVEARIEADSTAEVQAIGSTFRVYSPTTGTTSELDFKSGAALTKLGLAVETIVGQASNSQIRGQALEAATAADQIVSMLLAPTGKF